jgi:NlpC/P60 family putative phage cell wall peptidase
MRERVVAEARSWIGTPYHHRGRIKGVGVDCAQLLIGVYAAVGLIGDFETGEYPQDWAMHRDDEDFLHWVVAKGGREVQRALPGDVLLFRYGRCYSHGAIALDDDYMVHSYQGRGVELVERDEFRLKRFAAFTLIGDNDGR